MFSRSPTLPALRSSSSSFRAIRISTWALANELGHAQPEKLQTTYAVNQVNQPIDDAMVNRMRQTYSRDLIIEKVDDKTPGPQKEKAVYAVNTAGGPDARVVLDVEIKHP